jgi:hypothetical protein
MAWLAEMEEYLSNSHILITVDEEIINGMRNWRRVKVNRTTYV